MDFIRKGKKIVWIIVIIFIIIELNKSIIILKEQPNIIYSKVVSNITELPMIDYLTPSEYKQKQWWENEKYHFTDTVKNEREILVALIDVGVRECILQYQQIYINTREIPNNGMDDDKNGYIDDINGWNFVNDNANITNSNENSIHSSAIIGQLIGQNEKNKYSGLLTKYDVKILPIKALNDDTESGNINQIIEAIHYAEKAGADIVVMSFFTLEYSKELEINMKNSEMLFIVAAENDGMELNDDFKVYPACFSLDNVITIAAMNADEELCDFSNYGKYVDMMAPGENIICYLGEDNFVKEKGTSFSVPFVAAEAAIIACISKNELTTCQIKDIIVKNVDDNTCNKNIFSININRAIGTME